jgi:hypothetical protein
MRHMVRNRVNDTPIQHAPHADGVSNVSRLLDDAHTTNTATVSMPVPSAPVQPKRQLYSFRPKDGTENFICNSLLQTNYVHNVHSTSTRRRPRHHTVVPRSGRTICWHGQTIVRGAPAGDVQFTLIACAFVAPARALTIRIGIRAAWLRSISLVHRGAGRTTEQNGILSAGYVCTLLVSTLQLFHLFR